MRLLLRVISLVFFVGSAFANPSQSLLNDLSHQAPSLNKNVLRLALTAYDHARAKGMDHKQLLTVIDYQLPSTEKRLWVFDIPQHNLKFHTLVAHGRNSGLNRAYRFSNTPGSLETSLGLFRTGSTYYGHDGLSLNLIGLEPGINNHSYARRIVIHGAWYVSEGFARRYHRLGRSWGCPAVSERVVRPLINTIKNGTLVFAYYPQRYWLNHSSFLT